MDRTVIPNGGSPEHPGARQRFKAFCSRPDVALAYITGRHQALVKAAIIEYDLPEPHSAITDVGSRIYQVREDRWVPLTGWESEIEKDRNGKNHQPLKQLLHDVDALTLQEAGKQNTHKPSYYVSLDTDAQALIARIDARLKKSGVAASIIWSIDEPQNIGLLDILLLGRCPAGHLAFYAVISGHNRKTVDVQ